MLLNLTCPCGKSCEAVWAQPVLCIALIWINTTRFSVRRQTRPAVAFIHLLTHSLCFNLHSVHLSVSFCQDRDVQAGFCPNIRDFFEGAICFYFPVSPGSKRPCIQFPARYFSFSKCCHSNGISLSWHKHFWPAHVRLYCEGMKQGRANQAPTR